MLHTTWDQLRQEDGYQGLWPPFQTPYHRWVGSISLARPGSYYIYVNPHNLEEKWRKIPKIFLHSGDSGVGKSSLLVRFADNHFSGNYITTIGSIKFLLTTQRSQPSIFSTPNICRCGFQDPNNRDQRGASQTPDMGHCWAGFLKSDFIFQLIFAQLSSGAIPNNNVNILSRHTWRHCCLWCKLGRELRQCQEV